MPAASGVSFPPVGTAAIAMGPAAVELSDRERDRYLDLARVAIAVVLGARPAGDLRAVIEDGPLPDLHAGAFVTLTEGGELRGCMGILDEDEPAWRSVVEAARLAALGDPRFYPVVAAELARIRVEVSILGPMVAVFDASAFRPGIDGVVVRRDRRRGLLLPEVAGMLEDRHAAMLDAVCLKAGLPEDAWRDPRTELAVFRTCRFGGPAL